MNLLLASLPKDEFKKIEPLLTRVQMPLHQILDEPGVEIDYVYFPVTCMISMTTPLKNGAHIESATLGREGMSGVSVFHGLPTAVSSANVQMAGEALRMTSSDFRSALVEIPGLGVAVGLFVQALISMLAQTGACNGQHNVEERLSRWMLTIADRVGRDEFTITQSTWHR